MKLHNPRIDPRIVNVRSKAAQAYLVRHGWKLLAVVQPSLMTCAGPHAAKNPPIVHVALREQARDYSLRVIELVTDLALAEGRCPVDFFDELFQEKLDTPGWPAMDRDCNQRFIRTKNDIRKRIRGGIKSGPCTFPCGI